MSFIWPGMLLSLALIPLFVALYVRIQRRRKRLAASFGSLGLIQAAMGNGPGIRRHLPPALFLVGLTVLLAALARPQMLIQLPKVEGTVILAFDVSGSMAADDLQPNRMEAAKTAALNFVQHQPASVLIGVVAFSDNGFSVQPPTSDQNAILAAITRLAPERGTSLGQGIVASLNAIAMDAGGTPIEITETPSLPEGTYPAAAIVLLTDGENNEPPDPFAAVQAADDRQVKIHTVGIGSPSGATLNIEGFTVVTRLDEPMLQTISSLTGGNYYRAETEEDLLKIYENIQPHLVIKPEQMEITSIFAGLGILTLLIGSALSLVWFGRIP